MELLYCWIEEYDVLKKQEFNFGGEYLFNYNEVTGLLTKKINSNYVEGFFNILENKNIINVTAIIGENGAGKSTLLRFIRKQLFNKLAHVPSILIFKKNNEILGFIFGDLKVKPYNFDFTRISDRIGKRIYKSLQPVYYSTILDRTFEEENQFEQNLSTNYLLGTRNLNTNEYFRLKLNRDIRLYQLLSEVDFEDFPVRLPNQIIIRSNVNSSIVSTNLRVENIRKRLLLVYRNEKNIQEQGLIYFILILQDMIFTNRAVRNLANSNHILSRFLERLEMNINNKDISSQYLLSMNEAIQLSNTDQQVGYARLLNTSSKFLEYFSNLVWKNLIKIELSEKYLQYEMNVDEHFIEFLKEYYNTTFKSHYLNFTWRGLSSGEENLLDLFSRFYYMSNYINNKNSLIIFIDEFESHLHPQWQKQILYLFIYFFNILLPKKKIQIVLTSHSPFILSDLPHSNVILIKKNGDKRKVLTELEDLGLTFASNIHTLLSHSFFMQESLMGSFARFKINIILNKIITNSIDKLRGEEEEIRIEIHLIGEKIIRNKLLQLLDEKIGIQNEIQKEINELKERLILLERLKEDD